MIRLDKYLCEMNVGTRTQVKDMAKKGMITVNGEPVRETAQKIDEIRDVIAVNGNQVGFVEFEYFLLNKPAGVVSATEDKHFKTVTDLIVDKKRKDLFPVGRLDRDTEGLLLITNDGDLAHRLLSPKKHVDKTYYARIDGMVNDETVKYFNEGMTLSDGTKLMPGKLEIVGQKQLAEGFVSEILLTIREGKFHQVKRMFEEVGMKVIYLKRISMGPLKLTDDLPVGMYRELTDDEISLLKSMV